MSRALMYVLLSVCILIVVFVFFITSTSWYSRWYADLYERQVLKSLPRAFNLLVAIENCQEIETQRVNFRFYNGLRPESVFLKVGNSYYVPLYYDDPKYLQFSPPRTWGYIVLVDELPTSGIVFIRTKNAGLVQIPFVATQDKWDVRVTRKSDGQYCVDVTP